MSKPSGRKKAKPAPSAAPAASLDGVLTTSSRRQIYFWCGTLLAAILFLYLFRSILLPFVAGMALAYLLDPVADRLEAMGASRLVATFLILILFIILFIQFRPKGIIALKGRAAGD